MKNAYGDYYDGHYRVRFNTVAGSFVVERNWYFGRNPLFYINFFWYNLFKSKLEFRLLYRIDQF